VIIVVDYLGKVQERLGLMIVDEEGMGKEA